ncbi:hypothetical protein CHLRE_07g344771v5 [Chlamydomonas reinhardtii]|uniref:phytol kinase n=1 Tax=Chlamydomonas reinhardtii TaxID=3055 RepID=A0A2K3DKU6_CHLRE|nr:uncharacterized protein CHLRE_07g344771v5 [Chlamydomonas reinhardtii]PNW81159.1 hypothetical protein CHLRE_07g344771v5 [Chlamydomonas reinhardtii]
MTSIPALVVHQITAIKLQEVLRSRQGDPAGDQLVLALLRADTLAVYARLLAQTLATTRAAAARRGAATLYRSKLMLVMHVVDALRDVAECVGESSDAGLQQELVTALAHTQLLEHAVRALLHVAQATPAATGAAAGARASATSSATGTSDGDWTSVSQTAAVLCKTLLMCFVDNVSIASLCPRSRERDTLHDGTSKPEQLRLLEQMRPLLAAPGVQLFAGWAGLCAAMAVRQGAADGSIQQGLAPPVSQLRHGLPPKVVRPFQPPRTAEQLFIDMSGIGMACVIVLQVTVSGPCDLAIAQPPVGYDHLPHRQPQPQQLAGPSAAGSATAEGSAPASYSAVHAYGLLKEVWYGLACYGSKDLCTLCTAATVMARLLTELRPRQAAVLLPSWWQLLAQEPSMLIEGYRLARDAGELLRLQLNAPPPAAWAAGVTDAASAAAASVDWPSGTSEAQGAEAAVAAKAAASLARGRDPSYSLRCALDAGLLSTVERCLRAPQAWRQSDSASKLLYVVNCALRYSGVWPAVLARGPLQQAMSLIATLGAAARLLEANDTLLDTIALASQPGTGIVAQRSAGGYLCTYLAAMLEQVADVRALRENAQQQQQREWQQEQGRPEQQPLHQAHTDAAATDAAAAAAAPALYLNSVLERLGHKDGSVKPSTCSIAWMAAAGGLPAAGSTADRQQQLLASFAVYQWLPTLAKATEDALQGSVAAAERAARPLLQALLVGRLLVDVLWHRDCTWAEANGGAGGGGGGGARSTSLEGAWWEGVTPTMQLADGMSGIAYLFAAAAVEPLLKHCHACVQTAVLDLLQSYWTLFKHMARAATQSWAKSTARQQQQQQQQQQPPPPELVLQCLAPLPVQQLAAAHGRQDIVDYLDAVAEGVREELLIECGGAGAGGSSAEAQGPASREGGVLHASATADRLRQKWVGVVRPRYQWLLSQGQVQAGLHDLMVAEAAAAAAATATGEPSAACGGGDGSGGRSGSNSNTTSGGRQGSSSGGPVFEHKLCCNPQCCSLDSPSALIPPRSGKTCVRCRAATYCCGACQLADWRERHSSTCSGAAAATAGAAGATKAGVEKA